MDRHIESIAILSVSYRIGDKSAGNIGHVSFFDDFAYFSVLLSN